MSEDDDLLFQDEETQTEEINNTTIPLVDIDSDAQVIETWKMLIVDDAAEIHQVTRFALEDYQYGNRKLELLSAYSGSEAEQLLAEHQDIALIL